MRATLNATATWADTSGEDPLYALEGLIRDQQVYVTSIIEFRHSKIVKQTDYFANAFEAPGWRAKWFKPMDRV